MYVFLAVVHVVACIMLILIVLLQRGRGADMGAVFGGGSSQTIFGSSGPGTFLGKVTAVIAAVFMITSLWLAYSATHKGSVMEGSARPVVEQTVPSDQDTTGNTPQNTKQ
ncbi:MAG: preprotein translocase subunit SecG [Syntrophales bacterium]|nr:preprotein translocase subunit SecG [Syntrophales bacterium]